MSLPIYRAKVIDHHRTGRAIRRMRLENEVAQFKLGQELQRTKMQMFRLEEGRAAWSEDLVSRAVKAIRRLAK